jgi:hypothetical protein
VGRAGYNNPEVSTAQGEETTTFRDSWELSRAVIIIVVVVKDQDCICHRDIISPESIFVSILALPTPVSIADAQMRTRLASCARHPSA